MYRTDVLLSWNDVIIEISSMLLLAVPSAKAVWHLQNRFRKLGAVFAFLAGFAMLSGTSWYASDVLRTYYEKLFESQWDIINFPSEMWRQTVDIRRESRMVLGEAIFIGWTASFLCLLGGALAAFISCFSDSDESDYRREDIYVPPKIAKEYVWWICTELDLGK